RESDRGMVSAQPAPTDPGAARDAEPEATRPRCLLRGDGELLLVEPYESDRGANLAEVAFPAQLERLLRLGEPVGTAPAVSAAGSTGRPLGVPARVNRWPDEPDARNEHVRICGSPGWVTAQGDPASLRPPPSVTNRSPSGRLPRMTDVTRILSAIEQ